MPESIHEDPAEFFIGAYAAAPSHAAWDPSAEATFLKSVVELEGVAGLEIPFTGTLHKYDEAWFVRQLPRDAEFIVTTIPGTMNRLADDPGFGLASTNAAGRREAVAFIHDGLQAVDRLNNELGKAAVTAIEVHSAPMAAAGRASAAALAESLSEISEWAWNGTRVVLEHCDAFIAGRTPAKGFLPVEAEAEAVHRANASTGRSVAMAVNWGRSVIERRDPDAALHHIRFLRDAGLLGGFALSGCADVDTRFGPAWADVHVPPAPAAGLAEDPVIEQEALEMGSLLTADRMEQCLRAAGTGPSAGFRSIKVAAAPNSSVERRVAPIAATLKAARRVLGLVG